MARVTADSMEGAATSARRPVAPVTATTAQITAHVTRPPGLVVVARDGVATDAILRRVLATVTTREHARQPSPR